MKKLFYTILIIVLFPAAGVYAQAQLGADTASFTFPDTVVIGNYYNFTIKVNNVGDQTYTGPVHIQLKTDSMLQAVTAYSDSVTISPNAGISFDINNYQIDHQNFRTGKNVVVIWPASTVATFNVITKDVFALFPTGINENGKSQNENVIISPNPASNEISISYKLSKNNIEHVRIFDILGNEIYDHSGDIHTINIRDYDQGLYFIEFRFKDGDRLMKKFLK